MKRLLLTLALVLVATAAHAQTVGYNLRIYNKGAIAPISAPTFLLATAFTCGQAPLGGSTVANPTKLQFDDPSVAGKACIYQDAGTGPLLSMPNIPTSYEATLTTSVDGIETPESNRAPFARAVTPANLRLAR